MNKLQAEADKQRETMACAKTSNKVLRSKTCHIYGKISSSLSLSVHFWKAMLVDLSVSSSSAKSRFLQ